MAPQLEAGGWIPTILAWSKVTFNLVISFGAGILLGTVFFHMLPEVSPVLGKQVGLPIIIGFLSIFILEKFLMVHPCGEGECEYHHIGKAAYIGIGFHSILDGVAIGVGSMMNLSFVIIVAITVHKFPSAMALSSILIKGGAYSKQRVLAYMSVFALTTPFGALMTIYILKNVGTHLLGVAMGISAGTFLYLAIADLLPTVHEEHERKYKNLICFCLGIFLMMIFQSTI